MTEEFYLTALTTKEKETTGNVIQTKALNTQTGEFILMKESDLQKCSIIGMEKTELLCQMRMALMRSMDTRAHAIKGNLFEIQMDQKNNITLTCGHNKKIENVRGRFTINIPDDCSLSNPTLRIPRTNLHSTDNKRGKFNISVNYQEIENPRQTQTRDLQKLQERLQRNAKEIEDIMDKIQMIEKINEKQIELQNYIESMNSNITYGAGSTSVIIAILFVVTFVILCIVCKRITKLT